MARSRFPVLVLPLILLLTTTLPGAAAQKDWNALLFGNAQPHQAQRPAPRRRPGVSPQTVRAYADCAAFYSASIQEAERTGTLTSFQWHLLYQQRDVVLDALAAVLTLPAYERHLAAADLRLSLAAGGELSAHGALVQRYERYCVDLLTPLIEKD